MRGTLIRTRIMWTMILVAACALVVSGALVGVLHMRSADGRLTAHLQQVHSRVQSLTETGRDPGTGKALTDPAHVVRASLRNAVLTPAEGELGFVDGRLHLVSSNPDALHPEGDAELLAALAPRVLAQDSVIETIRTSTATYRVAVVPVTLDAQRATLVHVVDLDGANADFRRITGVYAAAAIATLALVGTLARMIVRRLLRPIEDLHAATATIDETDLSARVAVRGSDDLNRLADAFNRMLDRVQRAVEERNALLDDVGHELRTPITVARGHLELLDPDDRQDVVETRGIAIDELDRMGRLVDDLLLLAKSASTDFIRPVDCDLAELARQVFDKARALGDREWILERADAGGVVLDPERITQAWLQLADNAVKYSDLGSTIRLGSAIEGDAVRFWVEDEGIGIKPEDLERIRQRFGRTEAALTRAPGSGLGLSIVDSIASAHSGELRIESLAGRGSRFTVELPRRRAPSYEEGI